MSLEITKVQVNKSSNSGKIVAFATITLNESFCINGIKVIDGQNGLFIGMPSRKNKNNEYEDVCFPVNSETRKLFTEAILDKYKDGNKDGNTDPESPFDL